MTIGDLCCKIDSRSNYHGTCKFLVFVIICKFFIFFIIHFNKTYLNQMCNANNLSLTIGATRTYMFLKYTFDCRILWRSIKVVESTWNTISCYWILGLSYFRYCGSQIKTKDTCSHVVVVFGSFYKFCFLGYVDVFLKFE